MFFHFTPAVKNLIILGMILALSILVDVVAKRTRLPRISLLVLLGVGIAFVQQMVLNQDEPVLLGYLRKPLIDLALVMVAFLLGSELTAERMKSTGRRVLIISLTVVFVTVIVVGCGLLVTGMPFAAALSLAAVSVATDPAAVSHTIRRKGNKGIRAKILLGIVAIDDAWGIIVFGLLMAFTGFMLASDVTPALLHAAWELGGALLLGCAVGLPAAWLTGRLDPGEPTLAEAIALMLLLTGLSSALEVSSLLSAMVAGTLVANFAKHHTQSFREIEHIEWPFLVFFFVLSGTTLRLDTLDHTLLIMLAYILFRMAGRLLGGFIGVRLAGKKNPDEQLPGKLGLALTPQAGVAMGMALLAADRYPDYAGVIMPVVVVSTILFEMVGPFLVQNVLRRDSD
ncbi:MAG TPA: cation:proton antiporter [Bacteroidetes bacterium]|nr:cation:proton antiporter [Bacteroidota bacterium]